MKIRTVGAVLFHVGGRPGRHNEGSSRFMQICKGRQKFAHLRTMSGT